ncbi:MAG: PKD domain-containing protein, partial [Anaerolineae bacterium]|nr:PKD domain-containing protein [Anaerolineae bacterium]
PLTGYGTSTWHSSVAYAVSAPGPVFAQVERWDSDHLALLDWEASYGDVIVTDTVIYGAANEAWGPSTLYILNPLYGTAMEVGPVGIDHVTGMDFHPVSGVLYGVGNRPGDGTWILLTIDPATGNGSEVCAITPWPHPFGDAISDISFRSDGTLFAYLEGGDGLGTIDTGTCELTVLGPTGIECCGNGIGFTPDDILYHANDWSLNELDQVTGYATPLANLIYPPGEFPRLSALDYDPSSATMYGALVDGYGGSGPNYLATVDLTTGVVTSIGQSVNGLGAIAISQADLSAIWTGEIAEPMTITLTKWFQVEPCTWTQTLLQEELWLDAELLEERPVTINKLPPDLWIGSSYNSIVCPGMPAQFVLEYGNLGGYENAVTVYNEFPPQAPFAGSDPPPDDWDPAGTWAEWWVGDLPMDAEGHITVTVNITDTVLPGDMIYVYDWIIDHVGAWVGETEIAFEVGAPDITVDPLALEAELCPDLGAVLPLEICNVGDCDLTWALDELPPTPWLSTDPISGTLLPAECEIADVSLDSSGMAPGDYFADLHVTSNDPDTPQITVPVTLTVRQPAEIVTVTTVITELTVAFTSAVTGSEPIDYLWDLGDGSTYTIPHPTHTYTAAGCYTATLDIANDCSADIWSDQVCVEGAAPPTFYLYLPIIIKSD